jgi:hypothetical protein
MFKLLDVKNNNFSSKELIKICLEKLDNIEVDGKITKKEFINGLIADDDLRRLMLPFN